MTFHIRQTCGAWLLMGLIVLIDSGCGAGMAEAPPLHLTVATGEVGAPTTAVVPDGTVYWTWFEKTNGATDVYLARLDPGSETPSAPVRVNAVPGNANMHGQAPAQVAVGPDGAVYVAWTNRIDVEGRRFPASDLLFARSTDGGQTFEPTITVNDDAGERPSGHTFHDLDVGPDGTIYISWIDSRTVDAARALEAQPMDHADGAHMPGHHHSAHGLSGPEIRVAHSTDGGRTFSPGVVVDGTSCPCCRTALAVAPDGTVYVAWRKVFGGEIRDMAVARSTDGGQTFSAPVRVHEDGWHIDGCPHSGPALEVDRDGQVHIAWYTGAETGVGVFYAVSDDGGQHFGTPQALLSNVPVTQVRLAEGRDGQVWATWEDKPAQVLRLGQARQGHVQPLEMADALHGDGPALAAHSLAWALAWHHDDAIEAHVVRAGGP